MKFATVRLRLTRLFMAPLLLLVLSGQTFADDSAADDSAINDSDTEAQIERLVRQLDDDDVARRDEAEQALLKMASADTTDAEAFLAKIPAVDERMPPEVQTRLKRIRQQIGNQAAEQVVAATQLTIRGKGLALAEVLKAIEQQTGNRLMDYREQFGGQAEPIELDVDVEARQFWPALDELLDEAELAPYDFSGEEGLALVARPPGAAPRVGRAAYAGPFRIEVSQLMALRSLAQPEQSRMNVELNIAWEPRLKPIAISQPARDVNVVGDDGAPIAKVSPEATFDVEIPAGGHATELVIPLVLPERSVARLSSIAGKFTALVPGRVAELEFDDLAAGKPVEQQVGGITVALDRVVERQGLWEFHMRLRLGDNGDGSAKGLESHRGWVYQNLTFLRNNNGEKLDHAGFETTVSNESEVGFVYLFEIPDAVTNYAWVYRTPAAIVSVPVEYELNDVPLP